MGTCENYVKRVFYSRRDIQFSKWYLTSFQYSSNWLVCFSVGVGSLLTWIYFTWNMLSNPLGIDKNVKTLSKEHDKFAFPVFLLPFGFSFLFSLSGIQTTTTFPALMHQTVQTTVWMLTILFLLWTGSLGHVI